MRFEKNLSATDRRRVEEILKAFEPGEKAALTLSGLIDDWRRLAVTISRGESWSLCMFNGGLRTRNVIEAINEALSMDGRRHLQNELAAVDRDFIGATYDPLMLDGDVSVQTEIGWWQHRIPKDPSGTLDLGVPELGMGIEPPQHECGGLLS